MQFAAITAVLVGVIAVFRSFLTDDDGTRAAYEACAEQPAVSNVQTAGPVLTLEDDGRAIATTSMAAATCVLHELKAPTLLREQMVGLYPVRGHRTVTFRSTCSPRRTYIAEWTYQSKRGIELRIEQV